MKTRKVTVGLILATIAIWIGWDIFAAIESTPGDTESEVLRDWGFAHPAFALALGALFGHWFGGHDRLVAFRQRFPWSPAVLAAIGIGVAGADVAGLLPNIHPALSFFVGFPLGALLWAQKPPVVEQAPADESVEEEIAEVVRLLEESEPLISRDDDG